MSRNFSLDNLLFAHGQLIVAEGELITRRRNWCMVKCLKIWHLTCV